MKLTKFRFGLLLLTLLLANGLVKAQPVAKDLTIFGNKLGEPLSVPECPREVVKKGVGKYLSNVTSICWRHYNDEGDKYESKGVSHGYQKWLVLPSSEAPIYSTTNKYFIYVIDGRFEGINIGTLGYRTQNRVYQDLTAKYGEPSELTRKTVRNIYGASFELYKAIWSLENLSVLFEVWDLEFGPVEIRTKVAKDFDEELMRQVQGPTRRTL